MKKANGNKGSCKMKKIFVFVIFLSFFCFSQDKLTVNVDKEGKIDVSYKDKSIIKEGVGLNYIIFEKTDLNEEDFLKFSFEKNTENNFTLEKKGNTINYIYPWGILNLEYAREKDNFNITVNITNKTKKTIADFDFSIFNFYLPSGTVEINSPTNINAFLYYDAFRKRGNTFETTTLDNPGIIEVKYGMEKEFTDKILITCLTLNPPLNYGLRKKQDLWEFYIKGRVMAANQGETYIYPLGIPRILPNKKITFNFSIRFTDVNSDTDTIVVDIYQKFREYWKPHLEWKDRRPIGMLMLASSWEGHKSKTNPRGWFNNPNIDVFSEEGKKKFKEYALNYARNSVNILKSINAQGMIVWDIEGEEYPHAITYIGDPRMTKFLAPEMDEIADEFFKIFRDAGLRTGVCLRPTQIYYDENEKKWKHNSGAFFPEKNPLNENYLKLKPDDIPYVYFFPVVERLSRKIEYAKKRWGCTLFYIDSNGIWAPIGEEFKWQGILLWADILREIRKRHSDVLLIPEHARAPAYWSQSAKYFELRWGYPKTPDFIRKLFPGSFSIINVADVSEEKLKEWKKEVIEGVKNGDILLTHGWWVAPYTKFVGEIYKEVYKEGEINPWGEK
jgi:hypothetical protein